MPYDAPSIADMRDFAVALGTALFPELNFGSRRSYHGKFSTLYAGAITELSFHFDSAQRDLHPLTAGEGKPINDWANTVGVVPKGATPARKASAGRVRGNAGATAVSGTQLQHPSSGLMFAIANATTVTIPGVAGVDPDSFFDADIVGIDVGSQTRLEAGEELEFVGGAPAGLESRVVLQLALDEDGFDAEQFGSLRARFLRTFSETPSGGSAPDFATWAEQSLATVRKAYSYPNRAGRGTIDIAAFYAGTGSARSLSTQDRDAVRAYVQTKAPFHVAGEGGGLRVLQTVADPQRVELQIVANGVRAYLFDWADATPPLVDSWNPATRELVFDGPLPASMRAGHRIIPIGTVTGSGVDAQDGRQYRIESISGSDSVILETAPPTALAATDLLYSGGPLVDPIRASILEYMNGGTVYAGRGRTPIPESSAAPTVPTGPSVFGLDILAEGIGPANPDGLYGSWSGDLLQSTLYQIAMYKAGVRNVTIVSPAADYSPPVDEFPADFQVHYVTPSVVLIRSA